MNTCNLLKKHERDIRDVWFKNHEAKINSLGEISLLTWGKPDTVCYKIWYVLHEKHGTLMIYGDLGEAVYRWYSEVGFIGIAGFDLGYFHGKCCASELGRVIDNYEWDEEIARKTIFEHFKDTMDCKGYKAFKDSYASKTLHNKQEFIAELYQGDSIDIFGSDAWEWIYGAGDVIPIRCQAHLIGIKMAMEKLALSQKAEA